MVPRTALLVPGLALALTSSLLLSLVARADIPQPPDPCDSKAKDDACNVNGQAGACVTQKCSKLDYSKGTPPSSLEFDCLKCVAGAPTPAATPTPATTPTPAAATPAATPSAAPATEPAPKQASGCAIAGDSGGASLALMLLLAVGLRRSRRSIA